MTTPSIFDARKAEFRAIARAWDAAVQLCRGHPAEPTRSSPAAWATGSRTRRWSTRCCAGSRSTMPPNEPGVLRHPRTSPGRIYRTMHYAIDIWSDLGMLKVELNAGRRVSAMKFWMNSSGDARLALIANLD